MDMRNWQHLPGTEDPEIIQLFEQLQEEDTANCRACQEMIPPAHFRAGQRIIERDEGKFLIIPTDCGSNSRRFSVAERQFIGISHCTCDLCF